MESSIIFLNRANTANVVGLQTNSRLVVVKSDFELERIKIVTAKNKRTF